MHFERLFKTPKVSTALLMHKRITEAASEVATAAAAAALGNSNCKAEMGK
jgi:hypothetical protein